MSQPIRRWIWIPVLLVVLLVSGFLGSRWLERRVLEQSERILADLGGPGSTIRIAEVSLNLWAGDLSWSDVLIEQPAAGTDTTTAMRVGGRVEKVAIRGLSLWRLLTGRALSVRAIAIVHPDIELILSRDTTEAVEGRGMRITAFQADSVTLERAVFRMRWTGADSSAIAADELELRLTGLRGQWKADSPLELRFAKANGRAEGMRMALPPLYDLRIARLGIEEDGSRLLITNAAVKPRKGQQTYDQVVHFETDLFEAHIDTAAIDGLDLMALFNANTVHAGAMRVTGVELDVSRDRTMPDGPYTYKPLLSRLLRELPVALCLDSIVVDHWNVSYNEKGALTPDYGDLTFHELAGTIAGLCTAEGHADTLVVDATARLYDRTSMSMQVRMVVADSSDRFTAHARIGGLPISGFNRLTADLMRVRAVGGTIGGIDVNMTGDEERAFGRVDMEYEGLQLELLKQDGSGEKRRFMSGLVNQVVRSHNLRQDPNFRHGDFAIARRKDRFVFNYLWAGLREGITVSVLPGPVESVRQLDKAAKKK